MFAGSSKLNCAFTLELRISPLEQVDDGPLLLTSTWVISGVSGVISREKKASSTSCVP